MRKFRVFSDLHLEGRRYNIEELPADDTTTLILAGDIHTGNNATDFLKPLLARFQDVVYIMGNHEFYGTDINETRKWWRSAQRYKNNLHVLDNGVLEYHDMRIIGTTLWTQTNDPDMALYMNDYNVIFNHGNILTPSDTRELFLQNVDFLQDELEKEYDGKTLIVTHHAPIEACVQPDFIGNMLNKCFHANLEWMLKDYDIDMWIHGHMHQTVHTSYEGVDIFCNPRGYAGDDSNPNFTHDLVIEI